MNDTLNISIEFDAKGLIKELEDMIDEVHDVVDKELQKTAYKIQRTSKQLAPIDTGDLRRSIVVDGSNLEYEIGTNLEYAPFLEYGTKPHVIQGNPWLWWKGAKFPVKTVNHPGNKAYEYMGKSFDMHTDGLEDRIAKAIGGIL